MRESGSRHALFEVAGSFLRLGCTSFGGPVAHLGYLRAEFVEKRRWLEDARYAELVALCQALPGPTSSQVVFALGMLRAGLPGAVTASACFTLPSVLAMTAFALGVAGQPALQGAGWIHGLKLGAVAIVAQAAWALARSLCTDGPRVALCIGATSALLLVPGVATQLAVIGIGALAGWLLYRGRSGLPLDERRVPPAAGTRRTTVAALSAYGALLVVLPLLARATHSAALASFDGFYRAGALVFGGGHVVLPLLRAEAVAHGWLDDDRLLAGYAAAQAVPGPLFTFAAYVGTASATGALGWLRGLWCTLAIFLPGWLLVAGALPMWHALRARPDVRAALEGINAAVVGILVATLYDPVVTESIRGPTDAAAATSGFLLLASGRAPPWVVVALSAAVGAWLQPR